MNFVLLGQTGSLHVLNVYVRVNYFFLSADNFAAVFHSLDVWHKAKSIRKCLAKVRNDSCLLAKHNNQ